MRACTRDGRTYRSGDPGFREAWDANMHDITKSWVAAALAIHDERMRTDPAYRAREDGVAAQYAAIFNAEPKGEK